LPGNDGELAYFRTLNSPFPIIPRQGKSAFPPKTRQKQPLTGGGRVKMAIFSYFG